MTVGDGGWGGGRRGEGGRQYYYYYYYYEYDYYYYYEYDYYYYYEYEFYYYYEYYYYYNYVPVRSSPVTVVHAPASTHSATTRRAAACVTWTFLSPSATTAPRAQADQSTRRSLTLTRDP